MPSYDKRLPLYANIGQYRMLQVERASINASMRSAEEHELQIQTLKSYLDNLEASGRFLMGLLNDVLDISRIERNAIELYPQPYDLGEFRQQVDTLIIP